MELNIFNDNKENLNNKTKYECYRNTNNKLNNKNILDDEISFLDSIIFNK